MLKNTMQMRCWSKCVNDGVEDGMEDVGVMEARSSDGCGSGDVHSW